MSHLRYGGFGKRWRCKVRLVHGHLLVIFLIAVMLIAGSVAEASEKKAQQTSSLKLNEKWIGDFDGMVKDRVIRVLVVYSKTFYFLDHGRQRGISHDLLKEFEKFVNKKYKTKTLKVHVVFYPVRRDKLIAGLVDGFGDIAVANLTITPERQKHVDFSDPMLSGVKELLVTGPAAPTVNSIDDLAVREGGEIAWAFRKNSPKLKSIVAEFVKGHKKGTLLGNMLLKRYLKSTQYVKNALDDKELKKLNALVAFFKEYSDQYDFDHLMIAALAYQESGLDHSKRSHVGAVGVMQILPSTAADPNVAIPDIEKLEKNIHAGTKYLRFIIEQYYRNEPMDDINKMLFGFASYNAGPARVRGLREKASAMGLDPNR